MPTTTDVTCCYNFSKAIPHYTDAATTTRYMIGELVDHIDVYYAEKRVGITNQRALFHRNYIGVSDAPKADKKDADLSRARHRLLYETRSIMKRPVNSTVYKQ